MDAPYPAASVPQTGLQNQGPYTVHRISNRYLKRPHRGVRCVRNIDQGHSISGQSCAPVGIVLS